MAVAHNPNQNGILAALSVSDYKRVSATLELVPMELSTVLYEVGHPMKHAYFPVDCIVSLLNTTENGASAEVAMVGREGMIGIPIVMGGDTTPSRALIQCNGYAFRMPADTLKQEFRRSGSLQERLLRYTQAMITQISQTAVCNRHHSLEQQLCRWLLLSLDRLPSNVVNMTQELIANMLGVRREGVTEAAGKLQERGAIQYSRGRITILSRAMLEELACECYSVVKSESDRLLRNHP